MSLITANRRCSPPATGFFGFPPVSPRTYYGYANHDFANYETNIATREARSPVQRVADVCAIRCAGRNYKRQSEVDDRDVDATDVNGNAVTASTPLELLRVTRNHDTGRTQRQQRHRAHQPDRADLAVATGGVKHTVLSGLELAREELDRLNYLLDANPNYGRCAGADVVHVRFSIRIRHAAVATRRRRISTRWRKGDTVAVYVQDQLEFSPQWKALFGLRYEHFECGRRTAAMRDRRVTGAGRSRAPTTW